MEALFQLGFFALLAVIGLLFGTIGERRHYRSIRQREQALRDILVFNERQPPADMAGGGLALVQGSVVVSSDYFRQTAAGIKSLFGGRLTPYETLMDRGRREAILRMKEQARALGATAIFAVRLETASLKGEGRAGLACAEFLAYGTACTPAAP